MNEMWKSWSDQWSAQQQTVMNAMFSAAPVSQGGADAAKPMLEQQFAELRDTWKNSIEKWTEFAGQGAKPPPLTPEALRELFAPARWSGPAAGAFDAGLRTVLEGPKFATLWDLDRQLLELQQLAQQRDRDVAAYQAVVQKAWNSAFDRFAKSLTTQALPEAAGWRALADRWLGVANDTLVEVHRSDEFVEAQRRMLRSASDHRLQERKLAEAWCEACHIPTRTEMDEMQRAVTELRRQLRMQQRVGRAAPATAPSEPARRKPRATSAKPRRSTRT